MLTIVLSYYPPDITAPFGTFVAQCGECRVEGYTIKWVIANMCWKIGIEVNSDYFVQFGVGTRLFKK